MEEAEESRNESGEEYSSGSSDGCTKNDDYSGSSSGESEGEKSQDKDTKKNKEGTRKEASSNERRGRGVTRLVKLRKQFADSQGKKRTLEFDELGRFAGIYRPEFPSFLGDLVRSDVGLRYHKWKKVPKEVLDKLWDKITRQYDIDASRRKQIESHMGGMLRAFRRRLHRDHIQPYINKPSKLKAIPKDYSGIIDKKDWETFVNWTHIEEFKSISKRTKEVRAMSKYPHRMGRSGYSGLREKLVKNKELDEDVLPSRSLMWRKARENKNGEYEDDDLRVVVNKIVDHEKNIEEGSVQIDHGCDALTIEFGSDRPGRVRGAGMGVTPTKYWHNPIRKGLAKERITRLETQVAERDERYKNVYRTVEQQGQVINALVSHLMSQGVVLPQRLALPQPLIPTNTTSEKGRSLEIGKSSLVETPIDSNLSNRTMQDRPVRKPSTKTPQESPNQNTTGQVAPSEGSSLSVKCKLAHPDLRNIVACGTIYYSSRKQTVHHVPLPDDCYMVSIDEPIKPAAFLPIETAEHKTVGDAERGFVAWPKSLVIPDPKVSQATLDTHNDIHESKKRKKIYIRPSDIRKHTRHGGSKRIVAPRDLDK